MTDAGFPQIWALLGHRTGDNNQVLALCDALGLPFKTLSLRYNLLRAIKGKYLGATLATLTPDAARHVQPPWPDLVVAIGRRSVPVARWIRKQSGGLCKLVLIGHPRVEPGEFDLVITTPQYPVPAHDNVMLLTLAMARQQKSPEATPAEAKFTSSLPRPHLLLAIGGPTKYYDLPRAGMVAAARRIAARAEARGGTLIAVSSRRTGTAIVDDIRDALAATRHRLVTGRSPRFSLLLADADEIFVTADSMSMLSEAVLTGNPVGIVDVELNATGRKWLGKEAEAAGRAGHKRDLGKVWQALKDGGYAGTIDAPAQRDAANPVDQVARRVLALLGR